MALSTSVGDSTPHATIKELFSMTVEKLKATPMLSDMASKMETPS